MSSSFYISDVTPSPSPSRHASVRRRQPPPPLDTDISGLAEDVNDSARSRARRSRNDLFAMDWKAASPSRSEFGVKQETGPSVALEPQASGYSLRRSIDVRPDTGGTVPDSQPSKSAFDARSSIANSPSDFPSLSRLNLESLDSTRPVVQPSRPVIASNVRSDTDSHAVNRTARVDSLASNSTTMSTSPVHCEVPITPSSPVGPASQIPFVTPGKVIVVSPTAAASTTDRQDVAATDEEKPRKSLRIGHGKDDILGEGRCARVHRGIWQPCLGPCSFEKTSSRAGTVCAVKVFLSPDATTRQRAMEEGQVMRLLEPRATDERPERAERCLRLLAWVEEDDVTHEWPPSLSSDAMSRSRSGSLGFQRGHNRYRSGSSAASTIGLASPTVATFEPPTPSLYMVMPLMDCGTVDRMVASMPRIIGASLWSSWARQSLEALAWLHAHGVIHADVKPANLLVNAALDIRLGDFGSAVVLQDASCELPTDGLGRGTVSYSSPEIVDPNPDRHFGPPTDIFSLGVSLCQCLTGKAPYASRRTVEIMYLVRKGAFWATFERDRLARALLATDNAAIADVARQQQDAAVGGVRRSGSLREPAQSQRPLPRPPIPRMSSTEALVKRNRSQAGGQALGQYDEIGSRSNMLDEKAYSDGSPAMRFLDGTQRFPETYREMLKNMVDPDQDARLTADALLDYLGGL